MKRDRFGLCGNIRCVYDVEMCGFADVRPAAYVGILDAFEIRERFYRFASRKINLGTSCLTFFMRVAREIYVGASHNTGAV